MGGGVGPEVEDGGYEVGLAVECGQRMGVGVTGGPDLSPGSE